MAKEYKNRAMHSETKELQSFFFPGETPVTIQAASLEEALEKLSEMNKTTE
jgi:coproporphyrinogen III oxidase-like Fe-S oxidoreductase